jgi:hypothetical protein
MIVQSLATQGRNGKKLLILEVSISDLEALLKICSLILVLQIYNNLISNDSNFHKGSVERKLASYNILCDTTNDPYW